MNMKIWYGRLNHKRMNKHNFLEVIAMQKKTVKIWVMTLLLAVCLTGCGESDFPAGTYMRNPGGGKVIFTKEGEFTVYSGDLVIRGTYTYQDNVLTWQKYDFCELISMHNNATYKLTLEGDVLSFELVGEDKCLVREAYFVKANWIRQEE